jgi:hypothetical protein
MRRTSSWCLVFPTLCLTAIGSAPSAAAQRFQWPENPENIQSLSDTVRGEQLGEIMRGFTSALGVRCEFCHVGEGDLSEFDFPRDDKETKQIARVMIEMVRNINETRFQQLTKYGRPSAERVEVTCMTCHHGQQRPVMIEDVFLATVDSAGIDSAITQYRGLRDRYYGGFTYDFRSGPLNTVAERLAAQDRADEAIRVLQLSLEFEPDLYSTYFTMGRVQERAGRRDDALESLQKALDLAPPRFRGFIERELTRLRTP